MLQDDGDHSANTSLIRIGLGEEGSKHPDTIFAGACVAALIDDIMIAQIARGFQRRSGIFIAKPKRIMLRKEV